MVRSCKVVLAFYIQEGDVCAVTRLWILQGYWVFLQTYTVEEPILSKIKFVNTCFDLNYQLGCDC